MASLAEQKRQLIDRWRFEGFPDELIRAFEAVPREEFVPEQLRDSAYLDQPLPIGYDATISQPTTILIMLQLLMLREGQSVLEIGSGSGYLCALLAALGCRITGIEIVPEHAVAASKRLEKLGFGDQVTIHAADGGGGWEEDAPFDRIVFSAGIPDVPRHLFWQLKDGGILVAPIGAVEQRMVRCVRRKENDVTEEDHGAFMFGPLQGKYGLEGRGEVPDLPFV